jgi:hypothetical protein
VQGQSVPMLALVDSFRRAQGNVLETLGFVQPGASTALLPQAGTG